MEGVSGKWYLRVKNGEQYDLEKLSEHMADHNSGYSKGQIVGILTDMVKCIQEVILDGKTVKIPNLAIFSLGIHCKGADKAENATPANVVGMRVNARGTGELSSVQIREKAKLKELDEYSV